MSRFSDGLVPRAGSDAVRVAGIGSCARHGWSFVAVLVVAGLDADDGRRPTAVNLRIKVFLFELVEIRARVRGLVFQHLHEAVEGGGEERAEHGADPVDLGVPRVSVYGWFCGGQSGLPNDSGERYVRPPQGQRIELD